MNNNEMEPFKVFSIDLYNGKMLVPKDGKEFITFRPYKEGGSLVLHEIFGRIRERKRELFGRRLEHCITQMWIDYHESNPEFYSNEETKLWNQRKAWIESIFEEVSAD